MPYRNIGTAILAAFMSLLSVTTSKAATVSFSQTIEGPIETKTFLFANGPAPRPLVEARGSTVFSTEPIPFSLPQFDPALGILTQVELVYRLLPTEVRGQNSVLVVLDEACRARSTPLGCQKDLDTSIQFRAGLDILSLPETPGITERFAFQMFDVFVDAGRLTNSTAGPGVALTTNELQTGSTASLILNDELAPYIGVGDVDFRAVNAVGGVFELRCTAIDAPISFCGQRAQFFLKPRFEAKIIYSFDTPSPEPIPLPASFPLLLIGMLGLYQFRNSASKSKSVV